jgi:hypothetical protein
MSDNSSSSNNKSSFSSMVPSELRLTQKWDYAVETFLTRSAIGLVTAGLFSIVLFSKL